MNTLKFMRLSLFLLALSALTFACSSGGAEKADSNTEASAEGKEYTSAYICPMHCEGSGSDQPGNCPTCEMAYVANNSTQNSHDGHNHDGHNHDGHNHDHDGHDHSGHNH